MRLLNRRKHARRAVIIPCRIAGASERASFRLTDLTIGGGFVDTVAPISLGASITLYATLAVSEVQLTGRVSHVHPGRGFGFSIEFNELPEETRQRLAEFLREGAGSV